MTDSEKLDKLLKLVSEIREYIGSRPDCPKHLWSDKKRTEVALRQLMDSGYGYVEALERIQRGADNGSA